MGYSIESGRCFHWVPLSGSLPAPGPWSHPLSSLADERDRVQKKTFTKWVNKHLFKVSPSFAGAAAQPGERWSVPTFLWGSSRPALGSGGQDLTRAERMQVLGDSSFLVGGAAGRGLCAGGLHLVDLPSIPSLPPSIFQAALRTLLALGLSRPVPSPPSPLPPTPLSRGTETLCPRVLPGDGVGSLGR